MPRQWRVQEQEEHATAENGVPSLSIVFNLLAILLCLKGIREATRELHCQAHSIATHQV